MFGAPSHAAQLGYSLELGEQPATGTRVVRVGAWEVQLRLLGTSHQAIVRGGGGGEELCETVGRVVGADSVMPQWLERHDGGTRYVFRSCVQRPGADALRDRADVLRAHAREDPSAILGTAEGEDGRLTALACRPLLAGVGWATWHLCAAAGEVVFTRSRIVPA